MLVIHGGMPLSGCVAASGSKNAALPILAASILAGGPVHLRNVPRLTDVDTLSLVLGHLGVEVQRRLDGRVRIETVDPRPVRADYRLVRRMRGSFCVLGPLLARRGQAVVSLPGGCAIGDRPVDLHLQGLASLGAEIRLEAGYCVARARRLRGAHVHLSGPCGPTVTGTANVLSAATFSRGRTVITGAAREPEIVDLGQFLIALGARISGLGTSTVEIAGVESLAAADYTIIPDRIEAATLLLAAAITGGSATVERVVPEHLAAVFAVLTDAGAAIRIERDRVHLDAPVRPRAVDLTAMPYPGVPTDVQAQFMAWAALARGRSTIRDAVFPERFQHVGELRRLGAHIRHQGDTVTVTGVDRLSAADVTASDLRASAALVLAGLAAPGRTTVHRLAHLDRGYERLEAKLRALGACIERVPVRAKPPRETRRPRLPASSAR